MMLPEHKDRINLHNEQKNKQTKPELTEEEQQELYGRLRSSMLHTLRASIIVFKEYGNRQINGVVDWINPRTHLIKVDIGADWELIDFKDVLKVELDTPGY